MCVAASWRSREHRASLPIAQHRRRQEGRGKGGKCLTGSGIFLGESRHRRGEGGQSGNHSVSRKDAKRPPRPPRRHTRSGEAFRFRAWAGRIRTRQGLGGTGGAVRMASSELLSGRSGERSSFECRFDSCQPLFEGANLVLLRGDRGVLLLEFVEQHGVQHLVLHRLDLPVC